MSEKVIRKMKSFAKTYVARLCTFLDAWAPSSALALRTAGASLLELAVPCVVWKGIQMEEKK